MLSRAPRFTIPILSLAILLTSAYSMAGNDWHRHVKMKPSWPHLTGARDMNYDHLIVPGVRIGPVALGGSVMQAVSHLGNPDSINLSTFRGPGYYADEVYYYYTSECIWFTWIDSGIDPTVENGLRGINVDCDKWRTTSGIHIGSSPTEVVNTVGRYCDTKTSNGEMFIETLDGISFFAKDRYSPIHQIALVPTQTRWFGCNNN
jgi:hypothetical protein